MIKKSGVIVTVFVICILIISSSVYAYDIEKELGTNDLSLYAQISGTSEEFTARIGTILGVILTLGSLLSVIILVILGIKYITGSVEEKAEYKKTLKPYLIGAFLVFGVTNILNAVYQIFSNIF